MPSLGSKGKGKVKDGRQSRSRNTTPISVLSATVEGPPNATAYLEIPLGSMMIPTNILYEDILERHGSGGGIPDPKHLEALRNDLTALSHLAAARETACDGGMRDLSGRRKVRVEEEHEMEQANRDAEEKANLKRVAEDDDFERANPNKLKKRRDQSKIKEERPLTHGAHGVARQDGADASPKGKPSASPGLAKPSTASGSSSSLSPPSQVQSPTALNQPDATSSHPSPAPSDSTDDGHQPAPAASIPQYQTFGTNPLEFDDPTVYHVREIVDGMSDEEKREIYCVASFPYSDLKDLIAGTPPDKDFSNAKPSNQVNANTFATYLEPYFRSLTDEDMAFLKERGDRATPFLMPRRGTKTYTQVWAEEDGSTSVDGQQNKEKLPANQPRGSIDQMDDDTAETDQVSVGPMLSRLLSTMRFEHRPEEKEKSNGITNGEQSSNGVPTIDSNGDHAGDGGGDDRIPSATLFAESNGPAWKNPSVKQDFLQADERLKTELRYIGFLGLEDEPDYDAHYDDEVAQRLRLLQSELKKQIIINGARKARLAQIAEEYMGYQEFSHIRDDLDTQVVQAFSKRNRTMGKGKKNTKRPGGAGGGTHLAGGTGLGSGVSRPGIGDAARAIMDRRRRWNNTINPIFSGDVTKVRGENDSIFREEDMAPFITAEKERLEEEAD